MNFSYKHYRYASKKRSQKAFERVTKLIGELGRLDREHHCELLYFDESGFSPNPPVQYSWTRIGQTRSVESLAHRQRGNVLGTLRHDGQLIWTFQQRPTRRDDVIAFFYQIHDQRDFVPRIVLLDNAGINKGDAMEKQRRRWAKRTMFVLLAAIQSRTQSHRDTLKASQVFLASIHQRQRRLPTCRDSVLDERFWQRIHRKFWVST